MRFGFKPISTQPIHYESDGLGIENFFVAEGGHPIVALAVVAGVARICDEADQPFARAVSGQVRPSGIFILILKLMAIDAGGTFLEQIAAFVDQLRIILVSDVLNL